MNISHLQEGKDYTLHGQEGDVWKVCSFHSPFLPLKFVNNWYIANKKKGVAVKIGKVRYYGTNYYDKAIEECKRRIEWREKL